MNLKIRTFSMALAAMSATSYMYALPSNNNEERSSTKEKKSCLEKLNTLMSPEYKINSQLKDKKPQVLGELLNDLVVKTSESDKPIIKTTDQRHHGMCAAISTSRKVMAYEYKDKYVTMIMEELNNKPEMNVYDPTKLGTNAKISVPKTEVDFDYADDKGYRILDASALQWMNIAGNTGRGDVQSTHFSAFFSIIALKIFLSTSDTKTIFLNSFIFSSLKNFLYAFTLSPKNSK